MAINFPGSTLQQDGRYGNKDKKLMESIKFPASFSKKIDMRRVNLESIRPWISQTTTSMLGGIEDEILNSLIMNLLQQSTVDPRMIQVQITPFLEAKASTFMSVLWNLLMQAEATANGVPPTLTELFKKTITIGPKNSNADAYEEDLRSKRKTNTPEYRRRDRSPMRYSSGSVRNHRSPSPRASSYRSSRSTRSERSSHDDSSGRSRTTIHHDERDNREDADYSSRRRHHHHHHYTHRRHSRSRSPR